MSSTSSALSSTSSSVRNGMVSCSSQLNPEAAAPRLQRFNTGAAAHSVDSLLYHREAYSGSRVTLVAVEALENLENPLLVLRRYSNGVVFDPDAEALWQGSRRDAH